MAEERKRKRVLRDSMGFKPKELSAFQKKLDEHVRSRPKLQRRFKR
jgi:hypothetical protein